MPKTSVPAASKPLARSAGPARGPVVRRASDLLAAADRGDFPASLYLEGPSEPAKAALLTELKAAWRRHLPGSPPARVFRAAECSVEEILAVYHGASLFDPRELLIVLEVEDLGRSEKRIAALADGIARTSDTSTLVLVESSAETVRKTLEPLRQACQVQVVLWPPKRAELLGWGARRLQRDGLTAEKGAIETLVDGCEGDALTFFNELEKLIASSGTEGEIRRADSDALLRPTVGADLPEYLAAVALGNSALASQRLGRILAAGVGEGLVLWALGNLVGGALGGWSRERELSGTLRRRSTPRGLARALDAVYRAEAAWKGGRADPIAVLEQATRDVCAGE